ncbi:uncharacterized protein TRAVEDRAFT_49756 [Trametes versicolor FP-101664 SS1]|uniref:uncharacterized protein n=1 Tax=Trametes versicolor (strain FP-101664) TaxID=717944 RepID=UPI0004622A94|nr:uncharacterized protein TRAVEDRAFT_49756 [Trametes versicolor FP-101664 SS1]EIW56946.1 hypothetical protein TRAVEDRAFT_49756 [Trametes versicolor FP-101664 SS1]
MLARLSMLFLSALAVCTLFASSATAAVQRRDIGSAIDSLTSEAGSLASAGTAEVPTPTTSDVAHLEHHALPARTIPEPVLLRQHQSYIRGSTRDAGSGVHIAWLPITAECGRVGRTGSGVATTQRMQQRAFSVFNPNSCETPGETRIALEPQ